MARDLKNEDMIQDSDSSVMLNMWAQLSHSPADKSFCLQGAANQEEVDLTLSLSRLSIY